MLIYFSALIARRKHAAYALAREALAALDEQCGRLAGRGVDATAPPRGGSTHRMEAAPRRVPRAPATHLMGRHDECRRLLPLQPLPHLGPAAAH